MLPETRDTIVKMMNLKDVPSTEDAPLVPAWKAIPSELVDIVNGMEIAMKNRCRQRGVRWETVAVLVAPFIAVDMKTDDDGEEDKTPGIKNGTPVTVIMGRQRPKGVFLEKDGEMYLVQLEKDAEPTLVDPAKVIIKG